MTTQHGTAQAYVQHSHLEIQANSTAHIVQLCTAENDKVMHNWYMVMCFRKAIGDNFRDAVDEWYYSALLQPIFRYSMILPIKYVAHFKKVWVKLDERTTELLLKNYFRGWDHNQAHLSVFTTRLDLEQEEQDKDNVEVIEKAKMQHYMLQILDAKLFSREAMSTWTVR